MKGSQKIFKNKFLIYEKKGSALPSPNFQNIQELTLGPEIRYQGIWRGPRKNSEIKFPNLRKEGSALPPSNFKDLNY